MSNIEQRFSPQSLKEKLNSYVPGYLLNYDKTFMPNESKKKFVEIFSQQEQVIKKYQKKINFDKALEQHEGQDQVKQFKDLNILINKQMLNIKPENLMHFQYQWIFNILKIRIDNLSMFNILDDLTDNSDNIKLFKSQFLYLDVTLYLLILVNEDIQKEHADTQIHRIMIYDTYQKVVIHFLGFLQKFSHFMFGDADSIKQQIGSDFNQINNYVQDNFTEWIIKYFEELTKLLQRNERLNFKELKEVLIYVYIFLTAELITFTYLSSNENLDQQSTLCITLDLIQEPFIGLQNMFFHNQHSSLDELSKIETQFEKSFLWNYLFSLTIYKNSVQFSNLALQLYNNIEIEIDQNDGHFYHLFYQWQFFLFFTQSKIKFDEKVKNEVQNLLVSHMINLKMKQNYVVELLINNNKDFCNIIKKLIKKSLLFEENEEYSIVPKWLNSIKQQLLETLQEENILLFWQTYQQAILQQKGLFNDNDKSKNYFPIFSELKLMIANDSPLMLGCFHQFGLVCSFNLEKSQNPQKIAIFNTFIVFFTKFYHLVEGPEQMLYLEVMNKFFKNSLNFVFKNENITETLLQNSCKHGNTQNLFILVSAIFDLFDKDSTNRVQILSYFIKIVNMIKQNMTVNIQLVQKKLIDESQIGIFASELLFDMKLVSFICRIYAILGVGKKNQRKIIRGIEFSQTEEPIYKSLQTHFNSMSVTDIYSQFYQNGECQKIQRIFLQNKLYLEQIIEFALDACKLFEGINLPKQYDLKSTTLMLTKEIINLQYVIYYHNETYLYYEETNANIIYSLTYKLVINTAYLVNDKTHTIEWKDQIFYLLNQLMNLSVGCNFFYQVESHIFYQNNKYIKKIDKDLRNILCRFLDNNNDQIQMHFVLPKFFELVLSVLFEASSDIEHKFYILTILDVILASSIQATIQLHQILPKMILHLRLESNSQILKMMANSIQKVMYVKSDTTSFKALFQTMGHLPQMILRPFVEEKELLQKVQNIDEALQTPEYIIPLFNEEQRKLLSEIVSNQDYYKQTLAYLIQIIKCVLQSNFGRQNQFYFTGQQSGVQLKTPVPIKKNPKLGLNFQIVFLLKFEKLQLNQNIFKSNKNNFGSNVFSSHLFASSACILSLFIQIALFSQGQPNQQILLQFSNNKLNLSIIFVEKNQKPLMVITTQKDKEKKSLTIRHEYELPVRKDNKSWYMFQIMYGKKNKGFGFNVFVDGVNQKQFPSQIDDDLSSVMQSIDELNIGQDTQIFQKEQEEVFMNRSSISSQISVIQYQDDKIEDFTGFFEESQINMKNYQEFLDQPPLNFAGQIQMFYFLNGEINQETVYKMYKNQCKCQSKVFDEEIEKLFSGNNEINIQIDSVLIKLNLNIYENQNIANYKQFLDPAFIDQDQMRDKTIKNSLDQLIIVKNQQKVKEEESQNIFQSYFGSSISKKPQEVQQNLHQVNYKGVFFLDSYSVYDILLQFGHYELFYFVFFLLFRLENNAISTNQNRQNEEIFRQTLQIIHNIIEHFSELNIIQLPVEQYHQRAYRMIKFIICNYLQKCLTCKERINQILETDIKNEKKCSCLHDSYKRILDDNRQFQLSQIKDFDQGDERILNSWKSMQRKMTSLIGLWVFIKIYYKNYFNQDTLNMRIYLSGIIMKDDEFLLQDVEIHQHKYKVNKIEDKLRRKFHLKIVFLFKTLLQDKKWGDKPYALNESNTNSTAQTKILTEDGCDSFSPSILQATNNRKISQDSSLNNRSRGHSSMISILKVDFNETQIFQISNLSIGAMEEIKVQNKQNLQIDGSQGNISKLTQQEKEERSDKTRLQDNTRNKKRFNAEMITPKGGYFGFITLCETTIEFETDIKPENNKDFLIGCIPEMTILNVEKKKKWLWTQVREVLKYNIAKIHERSFLLQDVAIELFSKTDKTYFFNLFQVEKKKSLFKKIESLNLKKVTLIQHRKEHFKKKQYTEKWVKGEISNLNYLMQLNSASGRSYNDINQYFVFPWVLSEYKKDDIVLKNSFVYRDLGKPVGALDEERFRQFKECYDQRDESDVQSNMLYGSHFSHSTIILSYLMRLEPYAHLHHQLQGGKFDIPDRLFHSINSLFLTSLQDVKELIPEFFYMPDFLQNKNKLFLGQKQNTDKVDDVELPRWVKTQTPEEFIFIMRQSLENSNVSKNLHKWINLIFGYQNQGKEAVQADNLFHHITYQKNAETLLKQTSPQEQKSLMAQITFYGQNPHQLFDSPHPQKIDQKGQIFQDYKWNLDMTFQFQNLKSEILTMFHAPFVGLYVILKDFSSQFISWDRQISSQIVMNDATSKIKKDPIKLGNPTHYFNNPSSILCFISNEIQPLFDYHAIRDFSISNQYKAVKNTIVFVAVGGYNDNTFRLYNTKNNQYVCYKYHKRLITCIIYCPIEQILVVGSSDCRISIWKVNFEHPQLILTEPMLTLYGHHNQVTAVQVSGTLNIIVSADWNGMILVHHVGGRLLKCIRQELSLKDAIVQIVIHEGGFIITRTSGSLINVFNMNGAKYITNWMVEDPQEMITKLMLLSPLQGQFMVVTSKGRAYICDIFNIKYNQNQQDPTLSGFNQNKNFTKVYKDYEFIDYNKMKIANIGGDDLLLKQISNDENKYFQQKITSCLVNIEIEEKYSNLILILGMEDGKIYVFQNQDQSLIDLKRIKAGFKSLGL